MSRERSSTPQADQARGRSPRVRLLLLVAGGLAAIVMIALVALTTADMGVLRPHLERAATSALGERVAIEGGIELDLLGGPAIALGDVRVGEAEAPLLRARRLRLESRVAGLLQGETMPQSLRADGAEIQLIRGDDGNWPVAGNGGGGAEAPTLPAIHLTDASLHYRDGAAGLDIQAEDCRLSLPQPALAGASEGSMLARLRVEGELDCGHVQQGTLVISDLRATLHAEDGRLAAAPLRATVLDGELEGELQADFTGEVPSFELVYTLRGFALEAFLRDLASGAEASGRLDLSVSLQGSGQDRQSLTHSLNGRVRLSGQRLRVEGVDLDERLAEYRSTQRFNLVDVGAFLFAGPAGLAVTKGYDYTRLLQGGSGSTPIHALVSSWQIRDGIAEAEDVALATAENRLIAHGALNIPEQRFRDFRVLLVDERGCAVMEQAITGTFADPGIAETSMVASLLGPLTSLLERGIEALTPDDCEPVYQGDVSPP